MKLLKAIFILLFIFKLIPSHAQYFEGKLTYMITYEAKTDKYSIEDLENMNGDMMEYYIKNGNYKSVIYNNGEIISKNIYDPSNNLIYTIRPNSQYVQWQDCSYSSDSLLNMELSKDTLDINNYQCVELTKSSTDVNTTYYITDQFKVDPVTFKGHEMAFWHQKLELGNGALNAKIVSDRENYKETRNLIKVEEEKLSDDTWKIETDKMIIPSFREHTSPPEIDGNPQSYYRCVYKKIKYPKKARRQGIQGRVFIQFLVSEDGSVSNAEVVRGVHPLLDEEAMKGFNSCGRKWKPAYIDDQPVKSTMIIPITFSLD